MSIGPFEYVKSINEKKRIDDLSGYNPYLTNRAFAFHIDTVLYAEEMNQLHHLSPDLQYDFMYHSIRRGKRFGFPPKAEDPHNLDVVMEYFQFSKEKALDALRVLTLNDISSIISHMNKGGQ